MNDLDANAVSIANPGGQLGGQADAGSVEQSRAFGQIRSLDYLPENDRYLSRRPAPQFKFAIVGCGIMGVEHIRNTLLEGRASVDGIFDPAQGSRANAQQALAKGGQRVPAREYSSLEEALNDAAIDAFFICTPNFTHLDIMRTLLPAGKAMFVEKPVATTVEDAWQMCQLAAAHPHLVRFGLQYRYKAIYSEALHEVRERRSVGEVLAINLHEHRFPFLDKVGQWNKFNAYSGGTLVEKCCHYFDLMNLFAGGRPERVFATGRQAVNFTEFNYANQQADGLDQASVIVNYNNGCIATFELCMFVPGTSEQLIVSGSEGRLCAQESSRLGSENANRLEVWRGEQGASRVSHPRFPAYIERAGHHGSTFFEHAAFVDDLLAGRNSGPSLAEAFWSVVVGVAAQASISSGAPVNIVDCLPLGFDDALLLDRPTAGGEQL